MSRTTIVLTGILLLAAVQSAGACPVCFGETESNAQEGVNAAVWLMLGITGTVLGLISALFLHVRKRVRMTLNGSVDMPGTN